MELDFEVSEYCGIVEMYSGVLTLELLAVVYALVGTLIHQRCLGCINAFLPTCGVFLAKTAGAPLYLTSIAC